MLYQIHELSRKYAEPVAQLANLSAQLLTDPFLPSSYLPFARDIAAGCELAYRLGKTYGRPAFNMWNVAGQAVRPRDIRSVALFTIEGDRDDITGLGQTVAAHDLCPGIPAAKRRAYVAPDAGHYCIFSGRRWRQSIYPRLRSFIQEHDGARADRTGDPGIRKPFAGTAAPSLPAPCSP